MKTGVFLCSQAQYLSPKTPTVLLGVGSSLSPSSLLDLGDLDLDLGLLLPPPTLLLGDAGARPIGDRLLLAPPPPLGLGLLLLLLALPADPDLSRSPRSRDLERREWRSRGGDGLGEGMMEAVAVAVAVAVAAVTD
jgi:hypothetical protein